MSGTVTRIEKTREDPPRLVVFVDGTEAFTVSEKVGREMGLAEGVTLGPAVERAISEDDERERAREAALRLLAVRARSEGELTDRLKRKGFGEQATADVVSALREVGLVDDEAFALAWVDERLRLRPCGPRRLTQELLTRRVPRPLAERVVEETFREHDELAVAREAVAPRIRSAAGLAPAKRRARLHSFLLRRGFSYEVASAVLSEVERATEGESDA